MSYPAELYRSLQCGNNFTSWNIPQRLIYLQMDIYVIHNRSAMRISILFQSVTLSILFKCYAHFGTNMKIHQRQKSNLVLHGKLKSS